MLFLGNKAFVIDFLETGLLCCVCICSLPGKNCPGKIHIPHQNPDWPITPICLVCCCYPSTRVYFRGITVEFKVLVQGTGQMTW